MIETHSTTVAFPQRYTVWDLETTGLSAENDRIVEVAAIYVEDGKVVDAYSALLNHKMPIPEESSRIHGITQEMCDAEGIEPVIALDVLTQMLTKGDACITHNGIRFDAPFLLAELGRLGTHGIHNMSNVYDRLESQHIDTAVMYKAKKIGLIRAWNEQFNAFANRVMEVRAYGVKYNVGVCCDELGIDRSQVTQHRALGDITLTNEIYKKLAFQKQTEINIMQPLPIEQHISVLEKHMNGSVGEYHRGQI